MTKLLFKVFITRVIGRSWAAFLLCGSISSEALPAVTPGEPPAYILVEKNRTVCEILSETRSARNTHTVGAGLMTNK